jgi:hypothetical protein
MWRSHNSSTSDWGFCKHELWGLRSIATKAASLTFRENMISAFDSSDQSTANSSHSPSHLDKLLQVPFTALLAGSPEPDQTL